MLEIVVKPPNPSEITERDTLAPTVFHEHWWLDAATDGSYRDAVVTMGSKLVGRFPYVLKQLPLRRSICGMPELTHFLGPAIASLEGAQCNRVIRQGAIIRELLSQMPAATGFYHKMHAGVSDMLAFQQAGYEISVQFTHEIIPEAEQVLWRNMRDKTRNVIRRAREQLSVAELRDPTEFLLGYDVNLADRSRKNHYDHQTIKRVSTAALDLNRGRVLTARDSTGRLVAGIFYVWDRHRAYYLMTTRMSDSGNGSVSLLLWNAIVDCASRGLVFDFDGVAAGGDILFFTGFGGRVTPRYIASRYTARHILTARAVNLYRGSPNTKFT